MVEYYGKGILLKRPVTINSFVPFTRFIAPFTCLFSIQNLFVSTRFLNYSYFVCLMFSWDWESGWGGTVVRYEGRFCVVRTCFALCVAKKQGLKLPCDLCTGKLWNESPSQISFKIRTSFLKYCFQLCWCWYKFLMSLKCLNKTNFPGNGLVTLDFLFFFRLWQLKSVLAVGFIWNFYGGFGWTAVWSELEQIICKC